jgi:hypothetical protein
MHPTPTSPLGQVIAALIDLLIAALTEHAAEHPLLAPGCRASIRRLEKLSGKLQAMVAEWEATQPKAAPRSAGRSPPPYRAQKPAQAIHMTTKRRRDVASLRLSDFMRNSTGSARAPPRRSPHPRAPPSPAARPAPEKLPRNPSGREPHLRTPISAPSDPPPPAPWRAHSRPARPQPPDRRAAWRPRTRCSAPSPPGDAPDRAAAGRPAAPRR